MEYQNFVGARASQKVIAGLSLLTAYHAQGKDYLDVFVPLVAHCILLLKPDVISALELQAALEKEFHLRIPQSAINMILHRVEKKGYVVRVERAYKPNFEELNKLNFDSTRNDIIRQENAAIEKFISFAKTKFETEFTKEQAEEVLISYIRQNNIDLLYHTLGKSDVVLFNADRPDHRMNFIINSFIIHISENDPEGFKYIDTIIKGLFISYSLVFPQLDQISKKFKKTDVYLDTALILRRLYEMPRRSEPCKEMLSLLLQEGAAIKCFRHTREEVYNVINGCMLTMKAGQIGTGPTYKYFIQAGYDANDIELELVTLDKRIENAGINIVEKEDYGEKTGYQGKYLIDESKLEKLLISTDKYWEEHPRQRVHDVDCLSAIYRIRQGRDYNSIEECKAIFATANLTLCRVSSQFFLEEEKVERGSFPISITDYALTSLIWLKKPVEAPDLPQKLLVAQCYAAVEPNDTLWRRYLDTIKKLENNKLITSDDYYLLRNTHLAQSELMRITMGDEEVITEGTVEDILTRIKDDIKKEALEKLSEEEKKNKDRAEKDLAEILEERRQKEEEQRKLNFEKEQNKRKMEQLEHNLTENAKLVTNITTWILVAILAVLLVVTIIYSIRDYNGWIKYLLWFLVSIFTISMSIMTIFGITKKGINRYLKKRVTILLRKRFFPE